MVGETTTSDRQTMAATVIRSSAAWAILVPQVAVAISVDTAWIAAQGSSGRISGGIYMMDNMVRNGSSGEGTLALHTKCSAGNLIGFQTIPIDGAGSNGDQVVITAFADIEGNVFTGAGHPIQQPSPGGLPAGSYWIGQAMDASTEIYMIEIKVTVGQLQPVQYYVWWNATLTAT
jgi:hypothetical protein